LYEGEVEKRSFTQWSMAFKVLEPASAEQLLAGFEVFDREKTPQGIISDGQNRGKKTFLLLRETL